MADFCSLCYYGDINYQTLIDNNIEQIKKLLDEEGFCFISDGICEGCTAHNIKLNKDLTIEVFGDQYIGNLNPDTHQIEIDEESDTFKRIYKKKKENSELELKTLNRELGAVKHIAYALYMVGEGINISHHECIPFEEFEDKELMTKAWDIYINYKSGES